MRSFVQPKSSIHEPGPHVSTLAQWRIACRKLGRMAGMRHNVSSARWHIIVQVLQGSALVRAAPCSSSSSWVPRSAMVPCCSTTTSSEFCTVLSRCAMHSTVRPTAARSSASCTAASLSASSALVACAAHGVTSSGHGHCNEPSRQAPGRAQNPCGTTIETRQLFLFKELRQKPAQPCSQPWP